MPLLLIMTALLVAPYVAASLAGLDPAAAGRLGVALVFLLAAAGHFIKTAEMALMLPPAIPLRREIVWISGVMELAMGIGIVALNLLPGLSHLFVWSGYGIMLFFVVVFPINVYAAIKRVPLGGHEGGWQYLLIRTPVQLLLIVWTWYCFIHPLDQS